jgi:hypothetical protein
VMEEMVVSIQSGAILPHGYCTCMVGFVLL